MYRCIEDGREGWDFVCQEVEFEGEGDSDDQIAPELAGAGVAWEEEGVEHEDAKDSEEVVGKLLTQG